MVAHTYSLGARCLSEFIGMAMVIYTGEAALANELLPSTKGHAMGWGWTIFIFGLAFLAPLHIFGKVSAKLNPAMCLAQWVWGNLDGVDFVFLSLAEIAGAFLGAVLHWLHFLPHYKTLPEPPAADRDDDLLRRRDDLGASALQIASYATRPDRKVTANPLDPLRHTFYYLRPTETSAIVEETPEQLLADYYAGADALARRASSLNPRHRRPHQQQQPQSRHQSEHNGSSAGEGGASGHHDSNPLARRTIQVADLQRHLQETHVERVLRRRVCPKCTHSDGEDDGGGTGTDDDARRDRCLRGVGGEGGDAGSSRGGGGGGPSHHHGHGGSNGGAGGGADDVLIVDIPGEPSQPPPGAAGGRHPAAGKRRKRGGGGGGGAGYFAAGAVEAETRRAHALYRAAVTADQNAKLSIFATRPAIYAPVFNFITEAMGTTALLLLVMLVELQARRFPEGSDVKLFYEIGLQYLIIVFVVICCIGGLGGPTAYAANPARDLGPRLAHAILPIPNKGPSEWSYAWVPFFAPLVGGVIAGFLYIAIEELQFPGSLARGGGLYVG